MKLGTAAIAVILLAIALLAGCTKNATDADQIVGSSRIVSQQRPASAFSGIQLTGVGRVVITQDTVESLRVEANDNIIDKVTTSVHHGLLMIELQQGSYSNITLNLFVSMKDIGSLACVGAGEFLNSGQIHADTLRCSISGAGKMTLTGTATRETVIVSGAGDVHNFGLTSTYCVATISGAGNVEVNVLQQLDATINGTGNIAYSGNPQVINQAVSGIGSIHPGN